VRPSAIELGVGLPLALLAGVLVGTLGTFKHQVGVSAATGAGLPYGLVLSLAMVAAVLAALRVGFGTRLFAAAAAVGVIGAVLLLSLKGPGGSVVVLANGEAVVWTVGPALIAAVAVGAPRLRRRRERERADGILDGD
jgi:N-acetyl-1-D-myo-inositol-2-amino-2-deoxy-alpha-D-glucopyranoside deacetylase